MHSNGNSFGESIGNDLGGGSTYTTADGQHSLAGGLYRRLLTVTYIRL